MEYDILHPIRCEALTSKKSAGEIIVRSLLFLLFILEFPGKNFSVAHESRPLVVTLKFLSNGRVEGSVEMIPEDVMSKSEYLNIDNSILNVEAKYKTFRALSVDDLEEAWNSFGPSWAESIWLDTNKGSVRFLYNGIEIEHQSNTEQVRLGTVLIVADLKPGIDQFKLQSEKINGDLIIRINLEGQSEAFSELIKEGSEGSLIILTEPFSRSIFKTFFNFAELGFIHILPKGLDHILFVLGLILIVTRFKDLFWQISVFTLAHTITLALGFLEIVDISPNVVEPLIALSIIYVGIENCFINKIGRRRLGVIFFFGLLHGLGFAGVLSEIGMSETDLVLSLVGFNLGVEIGQLGVVFFAYVLVGRWVVGRDWYRSKIAIPVSILLSALAFFWFLQRLNLWS